MPLLIPQFDLTQEDNFLKLKLHLPYVKVTKSEFNIQETQFSFYLKPYLLNLNFKQQLKLSEQPYKCQYDPEKQDLVVYIEKLNHGEIFEDLQFITMLLKKKQDKQQQKKKKGNLIEIIDNIDNIDQIVQAEGNDINQFQYGFNNFYSDIFNDLDEELYEISVINPKEVPFSKRLDVGKEYIKQCFDQDAYLIDLLENEQVDNILEYHIKHKQSQFQFDIDEINQLSRLQKKEFIINELNRKLINNGIIDILFAFYYEYIIMEGELVNESAYTINQLSSQFSSLSINENMKDVIINNYQRCLTFPMIRNYEICQKVSGYIYEILEQKILIIKTFLKLQHLFRKSEPRQYLNMIYINDYLLYLQAIKDDELEQIKKEFKQIQITKNDLDLNLKHIEMIGIQQAFQDEQNE